MPCITPQHKLCLFFLHVFCFNNPGHTEHIMVFFIATTLVCRAFGENSPTVHTELARFEPSHPLWPDPVPPGMFSLDVILFLSLFLTFFSHQYAYSIFFFLTFGLGLLTAVNKKCAELWEACGDGQERRREESQCFVAQRPPPRS